MVTSVGYPYTGLYYNNVERFSITNCARILLDFINKHAMCLQRISAVIHVRVVHVRTPTSPVRMHTPGNSIHPSDRPTRHQPGLPTGCDRTHVTYGTSTGKTWFWYFAGISTKQVEFYYRKKGTSSAMKFDTSGTPAIDMKNGWWHSDGWTTGNYNYEQGVSISGGVIHWIFEESHRENVLGTAFKMPDCQTPSFSGSAKRC